MWWIYIGLNEIIKVGRKIPNTMVIVVAIEGVHGCGKTTFINKLKAAGRTVLEEGFMNDTMNEYSPTSIARQTVWIASWIQRVTQSAQKMNRRTPIYIDRSMYSTLMYNDNKEETKALRQIIEKSEHEMKEHGIAIVKVVINDQVKQAWTNIGQRLQKEPHRRTFNEHRRSHYDKIWHKYYEIYANTWDAAMNMPQTYCDDKTAIHTLDKAVETYVTNAGI